MFKIFKRRRRSSVPWALDRELWDFGRGDPHTVSDSMAGWVVFGATGSGKSTGPSEFFAKAHLRAGVGGFFSAVKPSDVHDQLRWCRESGRANDVVLFGDGMPFRFNFLHYEAQRGGSGARQTENIKTLLLNVLELRSRGAAHAAGGENGQYFKDAKEKALRSAIDVLLLGKARITVNDIYRVMISVPTTLADLKSPEFKERSHCFQCLQEADRAPKTASQRADLELAADFFLTELPTMGDRTRSSIVSTVTGAIDVLQRGVIRELLCTTTNVVPEDVFVGKIWINTMNTKEFGEVGKLAQVILKQSLQLAAERRDPQASPRPIFIHLDEFQEVVTSYDASFATTCRSARVSLGLLSQNLPTIYAAFGGGDEAKMQVDSLLGNMNLKCFCNNNCRATNEYAAETISRDRHYNVNISRGSGPEGFDALEAITGWGNRNNCNVSLSEVQEFMVRPVEFTRLRRGGPPHFEVDTIVFRPGLPFKATGRNWTRATFRQQLK